MSKTVQRIVKHIPFGEFYPRNLLVTLPYIEFLEKTPLWKNQWWFEQGSKSACGRLLSRASGLIPDSPSAEMDYRH